MAEGEQIRRWAPEKFADLDDARAIGEFPPWFRHYRKAAEETKHGILILQLTDGYFKLPAEHFAVIPLTAHIIAV